MAERKAPATQGEHKETPALLGPRRTVDVNRGALTTVVVTGGSNQLVPYLQVLMPTAERLGLDPTKTKPRTKPPSSGGNPPNALDVKRWAESLVDPNTLKGNDKKVAQGEVNYCCEILATILSRIPDDILKKYEQEQKALV